MGGTSTKDRIPTSANPFMPRLNPTSYTLEGGVVPSKSLASMG
ncbi:MAG: hypothetical protein PHU53_05040 [Thermoplasmata archaeon]|nr:hypothetical protein [Thermoplasmata archaeon]